MTSRKGHIRVGTRGSELARWQARTAAAAIGALPGSPGVEEVLITTRGDRLTGIPLFRVAGRSFFTKEIEEALLAGEIDVAVHSLKDLATVLPDGLALAAIMERDDPRDVFLGREGRDLDELAAGARIGTSSLRRRAFLARHYPHLEPAELRGNVPTRVMKLEAGEYDGIIVAAAGVNRLGRAGAITSWLPPDRFPPAPGQGAIALQIRADDEASRRWITALDHQPTRQAVTAERALLRRLEGGCQVPVGTWSHLAGDRLTLFAAVCSVDGAHLVSGELQAEVTAAEAAGIALAEQLLESGANRILAGIRSGSSPGRDELPLAGRRVIVTRPALPDDPLPTRLTRLGAAVLSWPMLTILPPRDPAPLKAALSDLGRYDWIIFSSARAVEAVFAHGTLQGTDLPGNVQIAATGSATARAVTDRGWPVVLVPDTFSGVSLLSLFAERDLAPGREIFFPASALAPDTVPEGLRALGARVHRVTAYDVGPAGVTAESCRADLAGDPIDAITFASPSAVNGLRDLLDPASFTTLMHTAAIAAIGSTTAAAVRASGHEPDAVADPSTLEGLAQAVVRALIGGTGPAGDRSPENRLPGENRDDQTTDHA